MLSYLALLVVAGLIDAATFVCGALVVGVSDPGTLLIIGAVCWVLTVLALLFVRGANGAHRYVTQSVEIEVDVL